MAADGDDPPGHRTKQRTSASIQAPSIFPLRPCCKRPTSLTLGCLVMDYFPEPVNVTLEAGNLNEGILTFSPDPLSPSRLTTTVVMTPPRKLAKSFTCGVLHTPSKTDDRKTFKACPSSNFTDPDVRLFHSSCDPRNSHSEIQLYCLISGYTPGDLEVTWLKNGQKITSRDAYTAPPKQEGKLASTHSELNITQEDWLSESTFTCQVTSQGQIYEAYAQKCTEQEPRGISVYLIPPSPLDLYINTAPKLTCLVVDLESKENVKVVWSRESRKPVSPDLWTSNEHFNATTSITTTLPVEAKDWIDGETYRCTVSHPDLPKDIVKSIAKAPGKRMVPEVYVFPPPKEQESQEQLTLTCLIQNFFPVDISVQWLHNEQLQSDRHSTTAPLKAKASSPAFFIFSRLEITRAEWVQNNQFTCRVIHEALPYNRTLEKTVSKTPEIELQDLCVEEAESEELEGLWTSTYIFISLFLLSVSYGATVTLFKVKWVLSAMLQGPPQTLHDYANILQPGA